MEEVEHLMKETISKLKENAGAYTERLSDISEKIELLKEKQKKEDEDLHSEHVEGDKCNCKIFLDLTKDDKKQEEFDLMHQELLKANKDTISSFALETKAYKGRYEEMKEQRQKLREWRSAADKKILRCPAIAFDKDTKHKDVSLTEEDGLHNTMSKDTADRHVRELTKVTGAVGNKCFFRNDICYFSLRAEVQIVRTKKIDKARLYDVFDVYIGPQDVIDQLRDPGVLYQYNMFGVNVWYSNMEEQVFIDILSSTRHLDRYALPKKVKHGGTFTLALGFLVDMPRATIHVLDDQERKLIGSASKLDTSKQMWPAVQIHHCYYEPQYFDTKIKFVSGLEQVKLDSTWRKYLLSLVQGAETQIWNELF